MLMRLNDLSMFVDERGNSDATPLLFIHGFPFDHSMWRHQMSHFSAGHHVFAPDLRGHGDTREVEHRSANVTVNTLADDLITLLDSALGNQSRLTICGLSLGGYTAFELWRLIPNRIERLILADTKAAPDTPEVRERRKSQAEQVAIHGARAISDGMLDSLLAPVHRHGVVGMEVRRMIESTDPQEITRILNALAARPDSTATLPTITVPTLVIVGELDKITPLSDARYMVQAIGNTARLAVIPEAGHLTALENPSAFNTALSNFLALYQH